MVIRYRNERKTKFAKNYMIYDKWYMDYYLAILYIANSTLYLICVYLFSLVNLEYIYIRYY